MRSHVAILKRPYLDLIVTGQKQVECRLTRVKCPPFGQIGPGEKIVLKESGGMVRGEAWVEVVRFFEPETPADVAKLYRDYNKLIMGAKEYWQDRCDCRFCSLIWLKDVKKIEPYRIKTSGMRAWLTYENR